MDKDTREMVIVELFKAWFSTRFSDDSPVKEKVIEEWIDFRKKFIVLYDKSSPPSTVKSADW